MSVAAGQDTIAAAFEAAPGRAALMPYLMGGFPDLDTSRAIGEAYAEAGADLVELGVPFSDPLELICLSGRGDKDLAEVLELLA